MVVEDAEGSLKRRDLKQSLGRIHGFARGEQ